MNAKGPGCGSGDPMMTAPELVTCAHCGDVITWEIHSRWGAMTAGSWAHDDGSPICNGVTPDTPAPFPRATPATWSAWEDLEGATP